MLGLSNAARAEETDNRREASRRALAASQRNDCPEALRILKPLLKPGATDGMSAESAALTYHIAAICYARLDQKKEAQHAALAGTALPGAQDGLWRFRLSYDVHLKDHKAAVATVVAMTHGRGQSLNTTPMRILFQLNGQLRDAGADALHLQFLKIVTDDAYDPDQPGLTKDGFRRTLAEKLLAKGDTPAAASLVAAIETASILVELSLDQRFRAIMPANFDPRAAAERELGRTLAAIERHPRSLALLVDGAGVLRSLGRPKQAMELLETARSGGKTLSEHVDAEDYTNWWWDAVARTNEMLGKPDAAFAAYSEGAALKEDGAGNVSQMINLAHSRNRFGRFAEALKGLPATDAGLAVSPYGSMELRLARGCANAALGNAAAFAADLAYAREHAKDHRDVLPGLLLCTGDMDGAATAVIANLEDSDYRVQMLLSLSDYDPQLPGHPVDPYLKALDALKQRPDVKAAIDKAGGIRRIALQRSGL